MTLLFTTNLQSIKYYGTLRRYDWFIPQCHNFLRNLCDAAKKVAMFLNYHFKRMLITGLGQ